MALTQQEKDFLSSIERKIIDFDIKISLSDCISIMNGSQVYTKYNDNSTELVDAAIEIYLIKNSFSYFIDKYGKVDIPGLGTIPMEPYYFQSEMAKEVHVHRKIVLDKTRQCLTENNFVMTNRGYISIKDVNPGDMIETIINGIPHFILVENFYNQGIKEVCRILTNSGMEIECTLDHNIMTKQGWKEAKDLSLNDEVVSLINKSNFGNFELNDDNHAALIGYYFADGRATQPSFVNTNIDYINEVLEIGKTFDNCYPYIYKRPKEENKKQGYDVRLSSKNKSTKLNRPILEFMEKYNLRKKSNDRILTNDLLNLNKKQMSILLNRLFAGDGYITYKRDNRRPNYIQYEIGLGAPNYTFIKQLEYILQTKYGIFCQVKEMFDKRHTQRFWKIRVQQKKSVIKFINEIGIKGKTDIEEIINLIANETPYKSNQLFEKIRKIEKLKNKKTVYDITTSTNDFISNGLLVHNCGMSTVFALYAFWKAHFFEAEMIDVVSTKQTKAQQFVKKINSTMESLPDWMKTPIKSQNQQRIVFQHSSGSSSEIVSESQSENAGRGDSLSVLILDEVAFYQSEKMVRQIIASAQPTLNKTGGQIILISCVVGDTYIYTENGLEQVIDYIPKNCKLGYNDIPEFKIDGIKLQQKCNIFYDSGITPTKKIYLQNGGMSETSEIHPYYIIDETSPFPYFKQSKDIKIGNYSLASCMEKTFGNNDDFYFNHAFTSHRDKYNIRNFNNRITEDMAYFFGLLIGDGYVNFDGQYCIITSNDEEVQHWLLNNPHFECYRETRKEDEIHFRLQGKYLVEMLKRLGFTKKLAKEKFIPKQLLQMNRKNIAAMLRGLFDSDGHSRTRDGTIGFGSTSKELLKQIKLLLDMFGIQISDERWNISSPEKSTRVNVESYIGKITLSKYFSKLFYEKIGFKIKRKQEKYESVKNIKHSNSQSYPDIKFWIRDNLINKYIDNKLQQKLAKETRKGYTSPARILRYENNNKTTRNHIKAILDYYDGILNHTEEYQKLLDFYEKDWYLLKVNKIEDGKAHTYDFVIPETRSFYGNGIIKSNTPSGTSGKGAYYYEQVVSARSGERGTRYIEVDWWEVPDDSRIGGPKKGYNNILGKAIKEKYYYSTEAKQKYKLYFEPIAREAFNDNEWLKASYQDLGDSTYRQEILHDFVIAGDKVFNEDILKRVEGKIKDPIRINKFGTEQIDGWWVWKNPIPGHRYIAAIDVGTGTGSDSSTIEVIDVGEYEQVAEYKGFISTPNFSRLIKKVARFYNESYVIIESNSIGEAIFNGVYYSDNEPYNNVFKQQKTKNNITRYTGWITDVKSRKLIVNDFIDWITVDDLWDQLKLYSKRMWLEMNTWIWTGGNKAEHAQGCVSGDTIITCEDGFKQIKDVAIGDKVLTHTGEFKCVYDTFKFKDESKKMLNVKSWGNEVLNITSNQEFYINDGEFRNFDDIYNFKSIRLNSIYSKKIEEYAGNKDELFLFFIGHVLSDGTISKKNNITITSENKESIIVFEKYMKYFKDKVENCYISEYPKEQFRRFTIKDKNLYNELKSIGVSNNKTIPSSLRYIDPTLQKNILMGYLFGDGCFSIERTGSITANSISYNLSYFISSILYRNGISFNVNKTKIHRYERKNNDQWSISILGKECLKIFENTLFNDIFYLKNNYVETSKFVKNKDGVKTSKLRNYSNNLLQSNIHSVYRIGWDDYYYDLSVEDDHSYVANGYIVHNSHDDSIMAFAIGIYNRNKAIISGESFLINEDGKSISASDNFDDVSVSKNNGFGIVSSEESSEEDEYIEKYGIGKEEYKWLIN